MKIYSNSSDNLVRKSELESYLPYITLSADYDAWNLYNQGKLTKFIVKSGSSFNIVKCNIKLDEEWGLRGDIFKNKKDGDTVTLYEQSRFLLIFVHTESTTRGLAYYYRLPATGYSLRDPDIVNAIHYIANMHNIDNFLQSSGQSNRYYKVDI